jgi:hypothetical protein
MNAKLYMIQNVNDKKWFNGKHKYFTKQLSLGTYALNDKKAKDIIAYYNLPDCEVVVINEQQFLESLASMTTKVIIQAESLKIQLEDIRYSLPTISGVNKVLGNFLKNTIEKLKLITPLYNEFTNKKEDETFEVSGYYEDYINQVAFTELYECAEISEIIKAYRKDKEKLINIATQILND